jgi:HD-GYP domain-containing protein (c-di-GMP phosphodiesterase class II)
MLKRIAISQVELGMFLHKLEGSWFKHPFWKSRFLLDDPSMLAELQESALDTVVIDTEKGLDLRAVPRRPVANDHTPPPPTVFRTARRSLQPVRREAAAHVDLRSTAPQTMTREFGLAKKVAGESRKVVSRMFLQARLGKTIKAAQVEPVIEDIFASIQRNPHAFNGLMRCKRDNEFVYRHVLAVSALMISLARQMKLPPAQIREAGLAGLLMDVGIGHLPVDLGAYGGDYRNVPFKVFEQHVELGHQLLTGGGGLSPRVLETCMAHHEALDGSGYPNKLKGDDIGLFPRMAAVCDTYDAMVSDTAEGVGMNPASAIEQLSYMKDWFDGDVLKQFIDMLGIYPIGSVVRLRSDRLAMVVDQDPADYSRPRLRTFWSIPQSKLIRSEYVELGSCYGEDEIVASVEPEDYGIADFAALRERLFALAGKAAA